jgi:hypothetical protein
MEIIRGFENSDRYKFDFGLCSAKHGWAQVDTEQDASYFGTWANPKSLKVFSYCEGDTTLQNCETAEEFAECLREIEKFEIDSGRKPARIDCMLSDEIKEAFLLVGLEDMIH